MPPEGPFYIIEAMVNEAINNTLIWATNANESDAIISHYLPWWSSHDCFYGKSEQSMICYDFYTNIIDPMLLKVSAVIGGLLKQTGSDYGWHVWYTRRMGKDMLLERGEDYRIVEFERQVLSNQIAAHPAVRERIRRERLL